MPQLDRTGVFNAKPVAWSLRAHRSNQSLVIDIDFVVLEWQDVLNGNWIDIKHCAYEVRGSQWLFGVRGDRQDQTIEMLVNVMGWDGTLEQFRLAPGKPGAWTPPDVQIKVERREWMNKTTGKPSESYEAKYINAIGFAGKHADISEASFAAAKAKADAAGLAAAVAAIKAGKPVPPAPTGFAPPAMTPSGFPATTMPAPGMPTYPPLGTPVPAPPAPPPEAAPRGPDYPPWAPPAAAPTAPQPPMPPGFVPFTGQF